MRKVFVVAALAIIVAGIVLACQKKEGDPVIYSGRYVFDVTTLVDKPVMYVLNDSTADRQALRNYLTGGDSSYFNFGVSTLPTSGAMTLEFLGNNQALATIRNKTAPVEMFAVNDHQYILVYKDSSIIIKNEGGSTRCGFYKHQLFVMNPDFAFCDQSGDSLQFNYDCKYKILCGLNEVNGKLFIPLVTARFRANSFGAGSAVCGFNYINASNMVYRPALGKLLAGDTVVIQTKQIPLIRENQ